MDKEEFIREYIERTNVVKKFLAENFENRHKNQDLLKAEFEILMKDWILLYIKIPPKWTKEINPNLLSEKLIYLEPNILAWADELIEQTKGNVQKLIFSSN